MEKTDLSQFDETIWHMVSLEIISCGFKLGRKGDKLRMLLSYPAYQHVLEYAQKGDVKIIDHTMVIRKSLYLDF